MTSPTTPEQPQTEAERLADTLDDEFCKGRISNNSGRKAAALLRALAAELAQARAELEGLKAQGQWISVKERLPAEGQPVLFIVKSSDHFNGRLLGGVFRNTAGMPGFSTPGVTYGASVWMPAPPAPPTGGV